MDGAYDPSPSWKFPAPRKPKPKKKPPQPNLLVILCDDLGYGDLACYGHPTIKTPNLDAMASAGLRLTSCYSSAPVCSSSRAGLLTGRAPSRVGVYDWIPGGHRMHLRAEEVSVASLLRDAGYQTCHVGKWHLNGKFNSNEQPQPDDHGFEYWYATQNNAAPSHKNPRNFVRNGDQVGQQEGFSCQLVADEAIKWLEERDESKPFFQFVCFHEPHEPVASPEELIKQYPDAKKKGEADYYANVTNMDAAVGRIMNALKEMKIDRKTMVLFTSDNGPETLKRYQRAWKSHGSPGPLRGMKLHLYEAGIRIPGILHWPGKIKSGVVSDEAISGVDILPTFCELANTEPPQDRVLDGTSFASLLSGSPVQRDKPLYWHYHRAIGEPKAAMRYGDWMLLGKWDGPQLPGGASLRAGDMALIKDAQLVDFELYNLASDLSQQHDLAASQPERVERLSRIMVDRYQEVQREGPAWEEPAKKAD